MNESGSSKSASAAYADHGGFAARPDAAQAPALEVIRLWGAGFDGDLRAAFDAALELRDARHKRVVFAELADDQVFSLEALRTLADNGFPVVAVSSEHRMEDVGGDELRAEVLQGLEQQAAGATLWDAPAVDELLARRIEAANAEMTPLTQEDVAQFLAGHYRLGGLDDGTR